MVSKIQWTRSTFSALQKKIIIRDLKVEVRSCIFAIEKHKALGNSRSNEGKNRRYPQRQQISEIEDNKPLKINQRQQVEDCSARTHELKPQ